MAAMKPRTGDGPMEVTKEGRGIVMRVPLEGGGRLVVELNAVEAAELAGAGLWALIDPGQPPSQGSNAPGPSLRTLGQIVDRLEDLSPQPWEKP